MGYYYGQPGPDDEKPPGCLDAVLITRAVFGVIMWPALAFVGAILAVGSVFWAFSIHPALALVPIAVIAAGIFAFARWEQRHFRPPGG